MPTVKSEITLLEMFSKSTVIAITINHEEMNDIEIKNTIAEYEYNYDLPTLDILKNGPDKLVQRIFEVFPELRLSAAIICKP